MAGLTMASSSAAIAAAAALAFRPALWRLWPVERGKK